MSSGGSVAQFGWIDYLRHRHEITLLVPVHVQAQRAAVEELRRLWPNVTLIPVVSAGSEARPTPLARIKAFVRELPVIRGAYHALARKFKPPPVGSGQLAALSRPLVAAAAIEARRGYDLIQVEYIEMVSMIHVLPPEVPNLFSHIEIQYVMRGRGRDEVSRTDSYHDYVYAQEKAYELDTLRRYDTLVTMSETDREFLRAELPDADIHASPFGFVPAPGEQAGFRLSAFADRITYIGGSMHSPNVDAVRWFLETMWPTLSGRFPNLVFQVIGDWHETVRREFRAGPNVVFTGFVEDVAALLRGSIMVVPLRVGSGIRTKILMAMTLGVPVVATPVGMEGIGTTNGAEILCAGDPEGFVEAVVRLMRDQAYADAVAQNASKFVQKHYSVDSAGARRDAIYGLVHARKKRASEMAASNASHPPT